MYGWVVVVVDLQLVRQVFISSFEELGNIQFNLSWMFGFGLVFVLDGDDYWWWCWLLVLFFYGKSMKNYEIIIEEEILCEIVNWL